MGVGSPFFFSFTSWQSRQEFWARVMGRKPSTPWGMRGGASAYGRGKTGSSPGALSFGFTGGGAGTSKTLALDSPRSRSAFPGAAEGVAADAGAAAGVAAGAARPDAQARRAARGIRRAR